MAQPTEQESEIGPQSAFLQERTSDAALDDDQEEYPLVVGHI